MDFQQRQRHGNTVIGNSGVGMGQLQGAGADAVAVEDGGVFKVAQFFGAREVAALFAGEVDAAGLTETEFVHEGAVFFARGALADHRHADV